MHKYLLFLVCLLNFSTIFSQENTFELKIKNDSIILKNGEEIKLSHLSKAFDKQTEPEYQDSTYLSSLTLRVDNITGDAFLEKIKQELKKTNFDILNIQRTSIQNFSNSSVVTDAMLTQYNTLVKDWKSLDEDERYYRDLELNFIKDIYKKMSFEQQVNNEKLPSFLPIFNNQPEENKIEQFLFEKWFFDDAYQVKIDGEKIEKTSLRQYTPQDFDHYFIERKIIGEQKIDVINLVLKD
ncbi:MAG: hypothetical protein ACTIKA_03650 [Psychroflexus halocasei]